MKKKHTIETVSIFPDDNIRENGIFLTEQLITYLGNKRSLLTFIGEAVNLVKKDLNKDKLEIVDIFSGSGVVSRYMKQHSSILFSNDLEDYCYTINKCYLTNKSDYPKERIEKYISEINLDMSKVSLDGFFQKYYAPKNDNDIKKGERVFFTTRNAKFIDTARQLIDRVPKKYQHFILAPLITEVSVKNNTSGVFKGFYKNTKTGLGQFGGNNKDALTRITNNIELKLPIFSNFECEVQIFRKDSNELVRELPLVDLVYMDPPYNQHPYGSNYFMLNLINSYKEPIDTSEVSGIPKAWNRSKYNQSKEAFNSLLDLCINVKAKYILISFNSEGFIRLPQMLELLSKVGSVQVMETKYNTFRGSRNLSQRALHVKEYLYLVKKKVGK